MSDIRMLFCKDAMIYSNTRYGAKRTTNLFFSKNESASGIVAHAPANIPIISIFRKAVHNG